MRRQELSGKRIGVAGCKHTTQEFISALIRHGWKPDHVLTISPEKGEKESVAGYHDLRPFLEDSGIDYTWANRYSLKSDEDREKLVALNLDVLFVIGWQRLIPDWWLESLPIGAFGMHGSSRHLPYGRGRSPMNWSLLQNKTAFFTHLFRYKPGVDDGDVVGFRSFDITLYDTALTLHYKNTVSMIQLVVDHLPSLLDGTVTFTPQDEHGATYYPKRTEEDGMIYWSDATMDIVNLVRAVTDPFPGAFTYLEGNPDQKITIWSAIPFDSQLVFPNAVPGEIVEVFTEGHFIVKTGTSSVLVMHHEGWDLQSQDVGKVLGPGTVTRKIYENIPL